MREAAVIACEGLQDNASCSTGTEAGFCNSGVCTPAGCGDGIVSAPEQCDGENLGGASCLTLGYYNPEGLRCTDRCEFDERQCTGFCGDGVADIDQGENCDGADLNETTCSDLGFYDEEGLGCTSFCRFATGACSGECGDGEIGGGESCDGEPPLGLSCTDFGFDMGTVSCSQFCTPGFADCSRIGFYPAPTGTGQWMNGLSAVSASDVFAVGGDGEIQHYDGTIWSPQQSPSTYTLTGVWAANSTSAFAVGYWGTLLRYAGGSWEQDDPPSGSPHYYGVSGTSASNVYAVGSGGTVAHWDGSAWHSIPTPIAGSIRAVWALDPGHIYVAGSDGSDGVILMYNGSTWTERYREPDAVFLSIWGSSENNYYIGGSFGSSIIHFDGVRFRQVWFDLRYQIRSIAGTGPNDVWVAGDWGLVYHFNGHKWRRIQEAINAPFSALTATPTGEIFGSTWYAAMFRNDGEKSWLHPMEGTGGIEQLSHHGPDFALAIGSEGEIWRFSGGYGWALDADLAIDTRALWAISAGSAFVTGLGGQIARWNGVEWIHTPSGTTEHLRGVWGSATNNVFAVGERGTILHFDGATWSPMNSNTSGHFYGAWGLSSSDVYAVGSAGVYHYDGTTWSSMNVPTTFTVRDIWGPSAEELYAATEGGEVLRYDGASWTQMATGNHLRLMQIHGTDGSDIWAAGASGQLIHYDGTAWQTVRTNSTSTITGLHVDTHRLTLTDTGGTTQFLRRTPTCLATEAQCNDGSDNDCDGAVDCADSDCIGSEACELGGLCTPASPIACGQTLQGDTRDGSGELSDYPCNPYSNVGPAKYYQFTAPLSGTLEASVTNHTANVDLYIVGSAPSGGCAPRDACLANAFNNENLITSAPITAGETYYLIVDSFTPETGTFDLTLNCE